MSTGYANSRTIDNLISFDLYKDVAELVDYYYPMFYQKGRDNTQLSKKFDFDGLGIIAVFSRRPKTIDSNSNYVCFSIQRNSFEQELILRELNIPVLYATPLETNISKVCYGCEIKWFKTIEEIDGNIEIDFYQKEQINYKNKIVNLDKITIVEMLSNIENKLTWQELINKLEEYDHLKKKRIFHDRHSFFMPNIQKPIFIVYRLIK